MRKMVAILSVAFVISVFTLPAHAQQPEIPTIGFLSATGPSPFKARADAFRQGLRELGYVDGRNITIRWLYAEWQFDRLPALASEFVRRKVDIIVSGGPAATRSLKQTTRSIPIVMGFDNDPVGSGFVASLARPGGNITGLSALAPGLSGKLLELLKAIVPSLSRLAVLKNSHEPGNAQAVREVEIAAKAIGIQPQYLDVVRLKDIEIAFRAVKEARADALLVLPSAVAGGHRTRVIALAAKNRLPAAYANPQSVQEGGLISYAPSFPDLYRRAATYVDKILKGANPADLPVEQPTKFNLVINLKTAKALGIQLPRSILLQATEVIE